MPKSQKYYRLDRPEMAQFLPRYYSRVLDVGCGEGRFVTNLRLPCECWGIEPESGPAGVAAERLHKVLRGSYEDVRADLPDAHFDLVICNDVIEHMTDHEFFLATVKSKMQDKAYLVGSIPNVRYIYNLYGLLVKKDWMYKDAGVLDRTHLRFFTEQSLRRTMSEHGFLVETVQGINSAITHGRAARSLMHKALIRLVQLGSLGWWRDVEFPQYAFRARFEKNIES